MRHMKWFQKIKKTEWELYWRAWLQQNTKSQPALVLGRTLPISNFLYFASRPLIKVFRLMSQDRGSSPRWPLGLVNFATVYFFQGARKSLQKGSAGWCWNLNLQNVQNDRNYRFRLWSRRNGGWFTVNWTGSIELNIFVFRAEEWWSD